MNATAAGRDKSVEGFFEAQEKYINCSDYAPDLIVVDHYILKKEQL